MKEGETVTTMPVSSPTTTQVPTTGAEDADGSYNDSHARNYNTRDLLAACAMTHVHVARCRMHSKTIEGVIGSIIDDPLNS